MAKFSEKPFKENFHMDTINFELIHNRVKDAFIKKQYVQTSSVQNKN